MKRTILAAALLAVSMLGASAQSPLSLTGSGGPASCSQGSVAVNAMGINGVAPYDAATRSLVCGIVVLNFFQFLDGLWVLDGYNSSSILVNLVKPGTYNLIRNGTPTCGVGGCSGTDATITADYFDTGLVQGAGKHCNLGTTILTSCVVFAWSNTDSQPVSGGVSVGAGTGATCITGTWVNPKNLSGNFTYGMDAAASVNVGAQVNASGFFSVGGEKLVTTVSQFHQLNGAAAVVDSTPAFSAAPTSTFSILGCHNGAIVYGGEARKIAVVGIGAFAPVAICHLINQYEIAVGSTSTNYC